MYKRQGHARTQDGKVKNSRLLLLASEHLRKTMETMARISATIMQAEQMQRFNQALLDAVADESPEAAQRIMDRIERTINAWNAREIDG